MLSKYKHELVMGNDKQLPIYHEHNNCLLMDKIKSENIKRTVIIDQENKIGNENRLLIYAPGPMVDKEKKCYSVAVNVAIAVLKPCKPTTDELST